MYWLLNHSSFSRLKTAFAFPTPSRVNRSISSCMDSSSRSSPGDHPSRARKFTKAAGRYPISA